MSRSKYDDFEYTSDFITSSFPDIDSFIKELDMFNENANKALRSAVRTCGDMIAGAQRRKIQYKSKRLASAISAGNIYTTEDGAIGIKVGYQSWAFEVDYDTDNPTRLGIIGLVYEFGRPGQSSATRSNPETYRHINGNASGFKVKKGTIQPIPHIRRGFDEIKPYCVKILINAYNAEIDKLGGGNQ